MILQAAFRKKKKHFTFQPLEVISGRMEFTFGGTVEELTTALKTALAQQLQVGNVNIPLAVSFS